MIFSLEVLKAKHGDCLLLHFGSESKKRLALIDGGPSGVFSNSLQPRLLAIKDALQLDQLPLDFVMVSHIDDDHINGIAALTSYLVQQKDDHKPLPYYIKNLWYNSFDNIIGNDELLLTKKSKNVGAVANDIGSGSIAGIDKLPADIAAIVTSVTQGRKLMKNAASLALAVNKQFAPMSGSPASMVRGDANSRAIDFEGLAIKVIHPNQQRLQGLQQEWNKELKKAAEKGDDTVVFASVAKLLTDSDKSPYNLSSIVCLLQLNNKTILLTGDARMDDIEAGLVNNQLLNAQGKLHVNIFKMPHHGSIRSSNASLLQKVTADHYVISADGSYDNPDTLLLDLLAEHIKPGATLHMTYPEGKKELGEKIASFRNLLSEKGIELNLDFPAPRQSSLMIDLGTPVTY